MNSEDKMVKFTEGFHGIEIKQGLMAKASNLVNEVSFVLNLFFVSFDNFDTSGARKVFAANSKAPKTGKK